MSYEEAKVSSGGDDFKTHIDAWEKHYSTNKGTIFKIGGKWFLFGYNISIVLNTLKECLILFFIKSNLRNPSFTFLKSVIHQEL